MISLDKFGEQSVIKQVDLPFQLLVISLRDSYGE